MKQTNNERENGFEEYTVCMRPFWCAEAGRSDWLTCVARKTGIARIVLCFLILATAIVMIWFCLTAAATAPEQVRMVPAASWWLWLIHLSHAWRLCVKWWPVSSRPSYGLSVSGSKSVFACFMCSPVPLISDFWLAGQHVSFGHPGLSGRVKNLSVWIFLDFHYTH